MTCQVTDEQKKKFASAYLLKKIVNEKLKIPVFLDGNDRDLEPVLEYMLTKNWVMIENAAVYEVSQQGMQHLEQFSKRYHDYLRFYDIYCAVDLAEGEFAFSRFFDFDTDQAWAKYLSNERWDDLRVAVGAYKGLDPVEIVFMSFLHEGRFGTGPQGWQFDLLLGSVWDEIIQICQTAIKVDQLGYTAEDGERISGASVIRDIITQGSHLNVRLLEQEARRNGAKGTSDIDKENAQFYAEDPDYVAPFWKDR